MFRRLFLTIGIETTHAPFLAKRTRRRLVGSALILAAPVSISDSFAKNYKMAKQKFRPTRLGGFSGVKAYMSYVKVLKDRRNAVGRTFCDVINL